MKKRVIRILCAMMAAVSLLTISAFAEKGEFKFTVRDHTEYTNAGTAYKGDTVNYASVMPDDGTGYNRGLVFRVGVGRGVSDDFATSSKSVSSLANFTISYSNGQNYDGYKSLLARKSVAAGESITMYGDWRP